MPCRRLAAVTSLSFHDQCAPMRRVLPSGTGMLACLATTLAAPCAAQTVTRLEADATLLASDNPFLLDGDGNGAIATELNASQNTRWSLLPSTTLELSADAAYRRYWSKYGDFLTGGVDVGVTHRDSEYLSFDAGLSLARELPADALTESIDHAADPRTVRKRIVGRASVRWTPDPYTEVTGTGSWENLRYPGSSLLASTNARQLRVSASRRVNSVTSLGLEARATRTKLPGAGDLATDGVFVTAAHRLAPNLEADGQVGVEWSDYDLAGSNRARLSGSGNICYRPEFTELCFTISLQSEVSGLGGLQREFYAGTTASRRIGPRSELSATADYRKAELGTLGLQTSAMRVNMTYRHRLNQRIWLNTGVDYLSRKFLTAPRNDAVVLQIGITFGLER